MYAKTFSEVRLVGFRPVQRQIHMPAMSAQQACNSMPA